MKLFVYPLLSGVFSVTATLVNANTSITCGQTYTVVAGDTLSQINSRAYGDIAFQELHSSNRAVIGDNPNLILVGQRLEVPCRDGTSVAATEQAEPAEESIQASATEVEEATLGNDVVLSFNKVSAPPFIINSGIIDLYLAEITEVTEGRVTFVDPDQMNRDAKAQFDLVTSGVVDATYVFNGHLATSHPLLQLPMLPLMGGSAEQTALSLWRLHDEYLSTTDYFDDAHLLGFVSAPAAHIWRLNDAPVMDGGIVDMNNYAVPYFEGLDTRGPPAVQDENAMRLASYDEAANGTLTFFMAHGAARAAGVWSDDRTVTEVDNGLYTPTFSVIMSNDAWDRISEADQAAITAISGEKLAARSASWDAFDNGLRQDMIDTGLNIVKADADLLASLEEELATRIQPWMAEAEALGLSADEAVAAYRANIASLQDRLLFQ